MVASCSSSKEILNFEEVKNGNHLNKATEIDIDTFLTIWLKNKQYSKVDFNLNEFYHDSIFTYFGKQTFKYQNLYKIRNESISGVNYKSIDGDIIKKRFYYEIIPEEDRNKQNKCSSASISINYIFHFNETENSFEIDCHYKVVCEFFIRIVKKNFKATYNIDDKTLRKV